MEIRSYLVDADPARPSPFTPGATLKKKGFTPEWPVGKPSPWRKVSILVTPAEIKASWYPAADSEAPLLLGITRPELEKSIREHTMIAKRLEVIAHKVEPRSGLGLFLHSAKASFRNVRLEQFP